MALTYLWSTVKIQKISSSTSIHCYYSWTVELDVQCQTNSTVIIVVDFIISITVTLTIPFSLNNIQSFCFLSVTGWSEKIYSALHLVVETSLMPPIMAIGNISPCHTLRRTFAKVSFIFFLQVYSFVSVLQTDWYTFVFSARALMATEKRLDNSNNTKFWK